MLNALKIFLPRILGGVVSAVAGWLYVQTRGIVTVDPAAVVEIGTAMVTSYALTHRGVSAKLNPDDSASRRMVTAVKEAIESGTAVVPERKP